MSLTDNWAEAIRLRESGEIVEVEIATPSHSRDGNFCGAHADIVGLKGFIPFKELELRQKPETLKGMKVPVKVLEADPNGGKGNSGRLILSRVRAVRELQQKRLADVHEGQVVRACVLKTIGSGALVDLGSYVTGHVHRSELSGDRSKEPSDIVQPGQEYEFEVLSVDTEKAEVRLSLRKVVEPRFIASLQEGQKIRGTIARLEEFGAFVDLGGPVDGLLHKSKMGGVKPKKGDELEFEIITLDVSGRRIGLARVYQEPTEDEEEDFWADLPLASGAPAA